MYIVPTKQYMHDFPLNGKYAASVATNEFDLNFSRHRVILTWYKNHLWHYNFSLIIILISSQFRDSAWCIRYFSLSATETALLT